MLKVILGFGNGNVENGCEHITVQIRDDDDKVIAQNNGSLPSSVQLWKLYNSWKSSFRKRFGGRIILGDKPGTSSSEQKRELNQYIEQFPTEFNKWLLTDGFRPIEKLLRDHFSFEETVNFTVEAEDHQLRCLPWYLWEFFEDFPNAEPAMAFTKYAGGRIGKSKRDNVRILVVVGDSQGIDTEVDKKIFQESFGDTQIEFLSQPSRQKLDAFLWDKQGWDILAFLGHSGSSEDGNTGKIKINEIDSLSLTELKHALSSAIKKGLQLAIFNSCDGLGLVRDLRDLYLPHTIVMREPVPDKVAQEFIKNFLPAFKDGKSLSMAVREAREKLHPWESVYPCATWLPVLCQNPAVESINWVHLGGKPACPYRGLSAFKEQDADIFFGREAVSEELYQRVESRLPLIVVVGASGSGKSSVVFAGLIPRLRNTEVEIVDFRPGRNPFESLAIALAPKWYEANHPGDDFQNLISHQRRYHELDLLIAKLKNKGGLCEVIETIVASSCRRLVIVADQFEELYTLLPNSESDICKLFLDSLLNAINDSAAFTLVLTLRADFLHYAIEDHKFAKELKDKNYILAPMNREELQRAIRIPAEKRGVKLEPGLLESLLDDVGEKAENLPPLEFALTQLWTKQKDGLLTRNSYQEIGGLQQSLARHAEDIYTQLNIEQRQIMKRVFVQLVRPGEGAADTRNVIYKSELLPTDWDLITFLNQENARLVVINYDQNQRETVEIVHEALINGWGRLNTWMGYHRQFRTWQERLKVGIKNWQEKHDDNAYLLTGGGLGEAEGWLNSQEHREFLSDTQRKFIRLSVYARDKKIKEEKQKQRRIILRLISALAIALVATVFAGTNWVNAEINATNSNLKSLVVSSKYFFDGDFHDDAIMEAMKASQLLSNTWWKKLIPNDIRQEVKGRLFDVSNDSIFAKNTLKGHQREVNCVAFSPDGNIIASASGDKTVKIWDAKTGKNIQTLQGHQHDVYSVAFSPDGNTIASASGDSTVIIWDAKTGKNIRTLQGHQKSVYSVAFSQYGNIIASASRDKTVKIWDAKTGKNIRTLQGHQNSVINVTFSPDGNTIASASRDKKVIIWDVKTGEDILTFQGHQSEVTSVVFSPDGKTIASTSTDNVLGDNTVIIWDAKTGKEIQTLKGHQSYVYSVTFSPNGNIIASASGDSTVIIWDAKTGKEIQTLKGHQGDVRSVTFSPNGNTIASASRDKTVKIWDAKTDKKIKTLKGHEKSVYRVTFSPDGNTIASASGDKKVIIWDVKTGEDILTFQGHQSEVTSVVFSPDGKTIASTSTDNVLGDNTVIIWDAKTGKHIQTLKGHESSVTSVAFSPDGNTIASASTDKKVIIWDVKTGEDILTFEEHQSEVTSVAFSPDGNTIASASTDNPLGDNTVIIWNAKTGKKIQPLKGHQSYVISVAFSPDGNIIASASFDKTVKIWNAKTGKEIQTLQGHQNYVTSVVFSPDGNTIASASTDKTAKIWDVKTGKEIQTLQGHQSFINSVVFSPDGNTIAFASSDDTVKLWNWDFDNLVEEGCNTFTHQLANHADELEQLKICQNKEIMKAAASTLVEEGEELAKDDNLEAAVEKLKKALQFDRNIDLDPKTQEIDNNPKVVAKKLTAPYFVTQGKEFVRKGEVKEAIAAYNKASKINHSLQISAEDWNALCWFGAINNHAKDVMFACEKAIALAPENGSAIDSRGLAKALSGDYKGAIEDFEVFVKWTYNDERRGQHQSWIDDLRNGKNPFTPGVLEKLRKGGE
jgi:WD40 repeat protein